MYVLLYSKAIYVQKSPFFTCYDVALLFWVFLRLVCCHVKKMRKVQYSCNIKGTYAPCSILFTEFSLDKNNKDMA